MHKKEPVGGLTLVELLVIVLLIGLVAVLLIPSYSSARRSSKKRDCVSNLKCIGVYLVLYVSKFGGERAYPPTNTSPNFLDYLRQIPDSNTAIARGADGLFVCKVAGTRPSPTALDYRYPASSRVIDDTCGPDVPIACDHPNNHWEENINVLLFDGSVQNITPTHNLWASCAGPGSSAWMQGPPNPCPERRVDDWRFHFQFASIGALVPVLLVVACWLLLRARAKEDRGEAR